MLKKLSLTLTIVLAIAVGMSFATQECDDWGCKDYQYADGMGKIDVGSKGKGGAIDMDGISLNQGGAFGISGAGGAARSNADGFIVNGMVKGKTSIVAGGLTVTKAITGKYRFDDGNGKGKYVGSSSTSYAITGGTLLIKVDPERGGFGMASGRMSGIAAQGNLNASYMTLGNQFENDGFTGGIAAQGSIGSFQGNAFVMSGGDYYRANGYLWVKVKGNGPKVGITQVKPFKWHPKKPSEWEWVGYNCVLIDSKAKVELLAEIEMEGGSSSLSWKEIHVDDGVRTEAMGTDVSAFTTVNTTGLRTLRDNGSGYASGCVTGTYTAIGGAAAYTQMSNDNANLSSTAKGVYFGHGTLNTNYSGSANGYTNGSITTVDGMKGSIVRSSAGMKVTSTVTGVER